MNRTGALRITPSERLALQLLANGAAVEKIAGCLGVCASEVESHMSRLFSAMGAASKTEALAIATRRGLLTPERL